MKFTDLLKEYQEHFLKVVKFYRDDFPEDATYVDFNLGILLKEPWNDYTYIWDNDYRTWGMSEYHSTNYYPIPEKPWYDPEDKSKSRIDVIGQNGNDGGHYDKPTGGKSSYYLVEIPLDAPTLEVDNEKGVVRFMLEEYIKYGLGNDFDRGNICKANHRLGNKQGVSVEYDTNKIEHYNHRIRKTFKEG